MEKQRFWFGVALAALPSAFLFVLFLIPAPVIEDIKTAPFEGHVSVQGRPLTHGFIVFYPEDESSDPAASFIDRDGHFQIGPRWLRNHAKGTRYRICVLPSKGRQVPHHVATLEDARSSGIPPREAVRVSDPRTTNLEVRLDAQAVEVNVDL